MTERKLHLPKAKQFATTSTTPSQGSIYTEQAILSWLDRSTFFPDLDEVLRRAGMGRWALRQLESDDEITAATDTRREAVVATPWHLEGADGKAATGDDVDFLTEQLDPWMEAMARAAWAAVPYGYSVWETVYAKQGNQIVIDYLSEKPFEWFQPTHEGGLRYRSFDSLVFLDVDTTYKFFHTVREPTYRQPYGHALYARLYWAWFFRKNGWQFWMKYLERWGVPFLVGHTMGKPDDMAKMLAKAVQNASLAVGPDDKVEVVSGTGSANFESFERAVTARIQKVILGQTLTSDVGGSSGKGTGSFALGKIHNEVREDRRNADIRLITRTIQRQVNALWTLNKCAGLPPNLKFEDDTGLQIERAQRDANLAQSGAIRLTPEYFLRTYDFEEGDIDLTPVAAAGNGDAADPADAGEPGEGAAPAKKKGALKASDEGKPRFTREQQAVEDLVASAKLPNPIDPAELKNAIRAARDPEDLAHRLGILFRDADRDTFARILEAALFAGDVMGYAHAKGTA